MSHVLLNSPNITFHQFLSMLSFIHLCINEEKIEIESHFNTHFDASAQYGITLDTLTYTMIIDFTTRVGNRKLPIEGMSKDVFRCIQYISQHPNEEIRVDDVAAFIKRSRSYITKKFRKELGFDISSFIMRCKLEEAKSLLTYTNKPLSEISSYLCFSSQSYFQNVFKKKYGMTPLQYRKNIQK